MGTKDREWALLGEVLCHSAVPHFAMTAEYSHATVEYLRRGDEELDDLAPEPWEQARVASGSPAAG